MDEALVRALMADLDLLAFQWDLEAKARHLDGLESSAESLRGCRDELKRVVKRHTKALGMK